MGPSIGSDPDRVGRPENTDNGAVHGHRHVHRAGVIGHADGRPPDEGDQPGDGRLSGKVMGAGASRDDCLAAGSIPGRPRNDNLEAGFEEVPADLCKAGNRPVLRFPDGPGHQDREGLSTQSVGPEQFLDRPRRLWRQVDREIRRAVVEPKHRREPKIPVHRMDIEGGDGDPVAIRDPGPLAGSGPSMLATPRGTPSTLRLGLTAGSVETDADRRTADQGKHRRPELAMQVDTSSYRFRRIAESSRNGPAVADQFWPK